VIRALLLDLDEPSGRTCPVRDLGELPALLPKLSR
jgi:hypothetical protein